MARPAKFHVARWQRGWDLRSKRDGHKTTLCNQPLAKKLAMTLPYYSEFLAKPENMQCSACALELNRLARIGGLKYAPKPGENEACGSAQTVVK